MIKKIDLNVNESIENNDLLLTYTPSFSNTEKELLKVKQAVIKLEASVTNGYTDGFQVNVVREANEEVVDFFVEVGANGYVCIDITDEVNEILKNSKNELKFRIVNGINLNLESRKEVLIDYITKKNVFSKSPYLDINSKQAGNGKINLVTGALKFKHDDFISHNANMPISISHVYNSLLLNKQNDEVIYKNGNILIPSYNCGNGWKLNLEQYLVKEKLNEDVNINKYTYVDAEGNQINFYEKYYYLNGNEEKIYLKPEQINIDSDKELFYLDSSGNKFVVKKEIESESALFLETEIEDFIGVEYIEKDAIEIATLKEEIQNIDETISDYEKNIEINERNNELNELMIEVSALSYEAQYKSYENELISIELQRNLIDKLKACHRIERSLSETTTPEIINKVNADVTTVNSKNSITKTSEWINDLQSVSITEKTYLEICNDLLAKINSLMEKEQYVGMWGGGFATDFSDGRSGGSLFRQENISIANHDAANRNYEVTREQIEFQISCLNEQNETLQENINKYRIIKKKKENELRELERLTEVYSITDSEGNIYGFSKTSIDNLYRLTTIKNPYNNVVYLNYKEDKLESITNNKNKKQFKFKYKNKLLSEVYNENNEKICFDYNNGKLVSIKYLDDTLSSYNYDQTGLLVECISPIGYGVQLQYNDKQVVSVSEFSDDIEILDQGEINFNNQKIINDTTLINYYDFKSTIVTNEKTKKVITYVYDEIGNLEIVYKNKFENGSILGNVEVKTYDRTDDKKTFIIENVSFAEEMLEGGNFEGYEKESLSENYLGDDLSCNEMSLVTTMNETYDNNNKRIYILDNKVNSENKIERYITADKLQKINNSRATDYILSGWARANSAFVNRRSTDYSKNNADDFNINDTELHNFVIKSEDLHKKNRRFELRAELKYMNNGEEKNIIQYYSYDWMNIGWQFVAFPITISENENDVLIEVKLVFDYSYNTNIAEFFGMSLKEGKWEYGEFNKDKLITYYENSLSDKSFTYLYDDDNNLVEEKMEKNGEKYITKYIYNSNKSMIKSVDYNNIVTENEYDSNGQLVKSYKYHISDPTTKIYNIEKLLDENGNIIKEVNQFGDEIASVEYQKEDNKIYSVKDIFDNKTIYGYDSKGETLIGFSKSINGDTNSTVFGYKYDLLTALKHNDFSYNYEYDGLGRLIKIKIAGNDYMDIEYDRIFENQLQEDGEYKNVLTKEKKKVILANGEIYETYSDVEGKVLLIEYTDKNGNKNILTENTYDTNDNLIKANKLFDDNTHVSYSYEYDKLDRITKKSYVLENEVIEVENTYDKYHNIISDSFKMGEKERTNRYEYDNYYENRINKLIIANNDVETIEYDSLNRVILVDLSNNLTKRYEYLQNNDHTSNLCSKEFFINNNTEECYEYEYDKLGNVICVKEDGVAVTYYTYDGLSRLIREDNKKLNKTVCFSYNKGGNITQIVEYAYSLSDVSKLNEGIVYNYKYNHKGWNDQITEYNGEHFEYDVMGNPVVYRNKNLVWIKGKYLKEYDSAVSYNYDTSGIRTRKTYGDITTKYYYSNSKLLAQNNGNLLLFNYDLNGVVGFTYEGVGEFYYKKNIFGDIIGILNSNYEEIVRYVYDARGNHKTYIFDGSGFVDISKDNTYNNIGSSNKLIAEMNPLRYRGYYYDSETDLYYLINRYYDPRTGRFISADSIGCIDQNNINGLNLYCYCNNNFIMNTDEYGNSWWSRIKGSIKNTVKKVTNAVKKIGNVIGTVSKKVENLYENVVSGSSWLIGAVTGQDIGTNIGDSNKPIVIYVESPTEWYKLNDYRFGFSINAGKFSGDLNVGLSGIGASFSGGNQSVDVFVGPFKAGFGTSTTTSTDNFFTTTYTEYFVNPTTIAAIVAAIAFTKGTIAPALLDFILQFAQGGL